MLQLVPVKTGGGYGATQSRPARFTNSSSWKFE